ncbi:MAG: MarR family winged helix-turn-helix transcriptional regulator [Pikeienuella sp.]
MWDEDEGVEDRLTRGFLAYRVERVHSRLTAQATKILARECGLTPRQWWIIADMMAERPRTSTDLARIAEIDKGLLSRNLKALADKGLVTLERDLNDRRQQIISLTEQGREIHAETIPVMKARNDALTRDMSEGEIKLLLDLLDKVEAAAGDTSFGTKPLRATPN